MHFSTRSDRGIDRAAAFNVPLSRDAIGARADGTIVTTGTERLAFRTLNRLPQHM